MNRRLLLLTIPALLLLAPSSNADVAAVLDATCDPTAQAHAYTFAGAVDLGPVTDPFVGPAGEALGLDWLVDRSFEVGAVQVVDGARDCGIQGGGSTSYCIEDYPRCCVLNGVDYCCVAVAPVGVSAAFVQGPCGGNDVVDECATNPLACCEWDSPPPCPPPCEVCRGDGDLEAGIGGGWFRGDHHGNVFEVVGNVVAYPLLKKYPPFIVGSDGDGDGVITDAYPDCRERSPGNQATFTTTCPVGADGGRWVVVEETWRPEGGFEGLDGAPAGFVRTYGYPYGG